MMDKTTAKIIDGKALADKIILELKGKIAQLSRPPGLAVILIGDDPPSHLYVKNKKKAAQKVGLEFHDYLCDQKCCPETTEEKILTMIDFLNNDPAIDGIIVQLPIPKKFNTEKIINQVDPAKDVDGFHPKNSKPPSPLIQAVGIALSATEEKLSGKTAVIVAKNPIFSQPLEKSLDKQGLKVETVKPDEKMAEKTKQADVLIVILGQKHFIKKSMVKPNAIVIDIGTNLEGPLDPARGKKNKWTGDVDPEVTEVASWLTPVPGGIGPLTVAYLLKNTFELAKNNQG